jgi:hypothetical protein
MTKHPFMLEDIRGAATALVGIVVRTPVFESMDVGDAK